MSMRWIKKVFTSTGEEATQTVPTSTSARAAIRQIDEDLFWANRTGTQILVSRLVPWKPGTTACPSSHPLFRPDAIVETTSAKSTFKQAVTLSNKMLPGGVLTTVAFAGFTSDGRGSFAPIGWCFWFSDGKKRTYIRIERGEEPSTDCFDRDPRFPFAPLPETWIDSLDLLRIAQNKGWGICKNMNAPMVGVMRLEMSEPKPLGSISEPLWQTPFVTFHQLGSEDVIGNIFIHALSEQVFFSPSGLGKEYTQLHSM